MSNIIYFILIKPNGNHRLNRVVASLTLTILYACITSSKSRVNELNYNESVSHKQYIKQRKQQQLNYARYTKQEATVPSTESSPITNRLITHDYRNSYACC